MRALREIGIGVVMVLAATAAAAASVEGVLSVVWGDGDPSWQAGSRMVVLLSTDEGQVVELDLGDHERQVLAAPWRLSGRRARVWFAEADAGADGPRAVVAISLADPESTSDVTGSQPWISLLCKFSNLAAEPDNLAFFQGMFDNSPGRLDHFWREVSYDTANVLGSTASNWRFLAHNQTYYVPTPGSGCLDGVTTNDADLGALFADCTAAHDAVVDFANGSQPFAGINLMFNSDLDGCAWGGGWYATLDGVSKVWQVTWEPPWGYANVGVMAHEMGHGFGLPHSNNWDNDGSPYDNSWDVMSDAWGWAGSDPVYGTVGKHTIAYHKDILGWIPASERFEVVSDGSFTIVIDHLALPSTTNYRMAKIPISGSSSFYVVEVRDLYGTYDGHLPGNAVIIHEVDEGRAQPAWCVDAAVPPGNTSAGEGSMWRVGESFIDAAAEITVSVDAATADGFQVTISRGTATLIFNDGFETGGTGQWTAAVP